MKIKNIDRARQLLDFENLMEGKIAMGDIDGIYEHHNKGWLFMEMKYLTKDLSYMQKQTLEKLVKDTSYKNDKTSMAVVLEHNIKDCLEHVVTKDCLVREYYYSRGGCKWKRPEKPITFNEFTMDYIKRMEVHYDEILASIL